MKGIIGIIGTFYLLLSGVAQAQIYADVKTSEGSFTIELDYTRAPKTCANFIRLAEGSCYWIDSTTGQVKKEPYYNGLIFHRVIDGFMSQTGSQKGDGSDGPGYNFQDEFGGSGHVGAYYVSMANSGPHTNGSQFFITAGATRHLDGVHSVFGMVVLHDTPGDGTPYIGAGREVCNAINAVDVGDADKPVEDVVIESVTIRRVGAAALNFDEHAQGLPEVKVRNPRIAVDGEKVELKLTLLMSAKTHYYYSEDMKSWSQGDSVYLDASKTPQGTIDVSEEVGEGVEMFFYASHTHYDDSVVQWPSELAGKTLTIVTRFGQTAFTFTSDQGGTLLHGGTLSGAFTVHDLRSDWLGSNIYLATNLTVGSNPVHFRLRLGYDSSSPLLLSGRHSGSIIYYAVSGSSSEATSGNMTQTR